MATQLDPIPRSNKSRANSQGRKPYDEQSEIISITPVNMTVQRVEPLTDEQRREFVAVAAYYLAERRNFKPGHETEDWLAAESQVGSLTTLDS
jgi:Protein of unknown function (DUF2934)